MHHWRQARQRNYTEFYDGMGEPAAVDPSEIDGGDPDPVVWIGASDTTDAVSASTLDARLVAFFHGLKCGGDELDEPSSDELDDEPGNELDAAPYIGADEEDELDVNDGDLDDEADADAADGDNPFDIAIAAADNVPSDDEKSPADILAECGDSH